MTNPTPRPWDMIKNATGGFTIGESEMYTTVAVVENEANAQLIVHCVNNFDALLEAAVAVENPLTWWDYEMKRCRYCRSTMTDDSGIIIHSDDCKITKLREAIDKAREK